MIQLKNTLTILLFSYKKPISDTSAFSKSSLNIWKFTVHILLKPDLDKFFYFFNLNLFILIGD